MVLRMFERRIKSHFSCLTILDIRCGQASVCGNSSRYTIMSLIFQLMMFFGVRSYLYETLRSVLFFHLVFELKARGPQRTQTLKSR